MGTPFDMPVEGKWNRSKIAPPPVEINTPKPATVDATLAERGDRYGPFEGHARITQNIKRAMADLPNWSMLPDDMKECLEMVAHKIGRILNGDPKYADSWHDIAGYSKLVDDALNGVKR